MPAKPPPLKAVLFDLDGVLCDTEGVWRDAVARAFAAAGIAFDDKLYAFCAGLDTETGLRQVLAQFPRLRPDPADLRHAIESAVRRTLTRDPRPMPGADDLLAELRRRAVPLALVSSSPAEIVRTVLERLRWRGHFDAVISAEEAGPGKPHPAGYREALRRLRLPPDDGVAVEDTLAGARAARGAGLRVLAMPGYPSEIPAIRALAIHVADSFPAAAEWLLAATSAAASRRNTGDHHRPHLRHKDKDSPA